MAAYAPIALGLIAGYADRMVEIVAEHETLIVSFLAVILSAFLGANKKTKSRTVIFLILWLSPLIYIALVTFFNRQEIEYEFGDW